MTTKTIDITVGDVRKSSDDYMDLGNCHLCNAISRTLQYSNISVGTLSVNSNKEKIGEVDPGYKEDDYNEDKKFVNSNPSLPDTHIIRTLQFKPTT